ncbi:MAG TPA: hypothetical protein ENJ80_03195, partial [Gammaproteobacteria bacterium]|nr:hypothetical protein [Gammaproteobacteria bacterium]
MTGLQNNKYYMEDVLMNNKKNIRLLWPASLYPLKSITRVFSFIVMVFCSHAAHADCIDAAGLTPVEILAAANRQQISILETVTSKQAAAAAVPVLEACKQQKRKAK